MKQTDVMKEQALKNFSNMNMELGVKVLVEKSISKLAIPTLLRPMQEMDWEAKSKYATTLESILKTSKTEEEVIQRAKEARMSL